MARTTTKRNSITVTPIKTAFVLTPGAGPVAVEPIPEEESIMISLPARTALKISLLLKMASNADAIDAALIDSQLRYLGCELGRATRGIPTPREFLPKMLPSRIY